MTEKFSNKKSVTIDAPVTDVWKALTDVGMIKQYFFGVEVRGDWKEGNTIIYKGEWQGKKFESKARVLQVEDQNLLKYSYWSNMSGQPDESEYYHIITYELSPENGGTKLVMTEENLTDQSMKERSAKIWDMVFDNLKKLVERKRQQGIMSR